MGIIIAAGITTVVVVALYGYLIWRLSVGADRRALLITALIALPLQPLAFYLLRVPLDGWLRSALGTGSLYLILTTFYAPLTEEPAKWLALAVPPARRLLRPDNVVPLAMAIGLGFGIGEIWFLAEQLMRVPDYAALPFWMFSGFLIERTYVCFLHGGFVLYLVHRLAHGRPRWPGALAGMALHYVLNLPIFLAGIGAFGLPQEAWITIASLFPLLIVVWIGMQMNAMSKGKFRLEALGNSTCPECQTLYPRPLLALNLGPMRYERCPNCRKFHMVRVFGQPGDKQTGGNA
jgi:hypothetical protein